VDRARNCADDQFVESLKRGDSEAWDAFMRRYDAVLKSIVSWSKWHFPGGLRDEICQTARGDLVRAIAGASSVSSLDRLVKTVAVRRCIDEVRRQVRGREISVPLLARTEGGEWAVPDVGAGAAFDPVAAIVRMERTCALRRLLQELEPLCLSALRQFYMEGRSYREMAEQLGISVNTVGSRLSKCLTRLKKLARRDEVFREDFGGRCD
jgi:RNA polymerase sigma factor (sigma-70 family)